MTQSDAVAPKRLSNRSITYAESIAEPNGRPSLAVQPDTLLNLLLRQFVWPTHLYSYSNECIPNAGRVLLQLLPNVSQGQAGTVEVRGFDHLSFGEPALSDLYPVRRKEPGDRGATDAVPATELSHHGPGSIRRQELFDLFGCEALTQLVQF